MNKRTGSLLLLVLILISACGTRVIRGSGVIDSEKREVGNFNEVSVCCGMQLVIHQGEDASVEIEADDNLLPEIDSRVSGSRLVIDYREGFLQTSFRPSATVKVYVTMEEMRRAHVSGGGGLEIGQFETEDAAISMSGGSTAIVEQLVANELAIDISGGGKITAAEFEGSSIHVDLSGGSQATFGTLLAGNLKVDISGGGRLVISDAELEETGLGLSGGSSAVIDALSGDLLTLSISGGGTAQIAGEIDEQQVDLSGTSTYDAADLKSRQTTIEAGGNASVWATERLSVDLSGGSTVEYRGDPSINQELSGGSQLVPLRGR